MVSQPCLPDGITFSTQSQIDSFPISYSGCTEIEGSVQIGHFSSTDDITNLTGLNVLTSIGGDLYILYNDSLTNLIGLEGMTSIGGDFKIMGNHAILYISEMVGLISITKSLYIWYNSALTSLEFEGLTSIGEHLVIGANNDLSILTGMEGVTSIGGSLSIYSNYSLFSLSGLEGVTSFGERVDIEGNNSLTDLSGLEGVTSIGGGSLNIINNDALYSLEGLKNIESNTIEGLHIHDNDLLSTCDVESVCAYLANPNGDIQIYMNAQGCNNIVEVEEACTVGILESESETQLSAYPNPFTTFTTIEYELTEPTHVQLTIYNAIGGEVYTAEDRLMAEGKHSFVWSTDRLPEGMYYAVLRSEEGVSVVKIVKQR
jgi:hypothetical protein